MAKRCEVFGGDDRGRRKVHEGAGREMTRSCFELHCPSLMWLTNRGASSYLWRDEGVYGGFSPCSPDTNPVFLCRIKEMMEGVTGLILSALFLVPSFALAQDIPSTATNPPAQTDQNTPPPKQETPQPQTNPASQSNLPNAPSSVITGKPHGQGQIPLQDVPHPAVELKLVPLNVVGDTYRTFTSPIYMRAGDLKWMLPVAAAAGVALSQDSHVARDIVSHDPGFNNTADNVSSDILYSYVAGSVTMYGAGLLKHNDHLSETGLLSGEAQISAEILDSIVKLGSFRERPNVDNFSGRFFQLSAGTDSSFISGHAMVTWSAAAVIAAEYPSPWTQVGVYSGATATALTRVLAEKHFPTDVLLGSTAGWMIGHYVVRAHHHHPIFHRRPSAASTDF